MAQWNFIFIALKVYFYEGGKIFSDSMMYQISDYLIAYEYWFFKKNHKLLDFALCVC